MNWRCLVRHDWTGWSAFYPRWVLRSFGIDRQKWRRHCRRCGTQQVRASRPRTAVEVS